MGWRDLGPGGRAGWLGRWGRRWGVFWATGLLATGLAAQTLNDTGMTQCVQPSLTTSPMPLADCAGSGQDGETGRDARALPSRNGVAGFSFIKVGTQGEHLPVWAAFWHCIFDPVTGLLWERKTGDGGLHDFRSRYTNWGDGRGLDATWLAALANERGLCGHNDWRVPNHLELHSLMHLGATTGVVLDGTYFLDTLPYAYWASTGVANAPGEAWAANFGTGHVLGGGSRANYLRVRLVRSDGPPLAPTLAWASGPSVRMTGWGRTWQRCLAGQDWRAGRCRGTPQLMTWPDALAYAQAEAARTGQPWRLPNPKELLALLDPTRDQPALSPEAFPGGKSLRQWTSTPAADRRNVWAVDFAFGGADLRSPDTLLAVRLIRGGP